MRLAALGFSQAAHFACHYGLRVFVVLTAAADATVPSGAAWHVVAALFMLPAILLVPIYGALGNSLPKRAALIGAAAYGLVIFVIFTLLGHGWLLCVVLAAAGSTLYAPTRHALLAAAAREADLPLPRVVSWIETSAVLSIVGGMVLGGELTPWRWADLGVEGTAWERIPVAMAVLTALAALCLAGALLAWFPTDVRRAEAALPALRGFFRDARRIVADRRSGLSLAGIAYLRGVVTVAAGAFIARALQQDIGEGPAAAIGPLIEIAVLSMAGAAIGSFLAGFVGEGRRSLGLVPWGATGLVGSVLWVTAFTSVPLWLCVLVGACGGLVNVPLIAAFQHYVPADARGNANAILNTTGFLSMTLLSATLAVLAGTGLLTPVGQFWFVAALAGVGTAAAWVALGPHALGRGGQSALSTKSPA
jgi:hypothetical protein